MVRDANLDLSGQNQTCSYFTYNSDNSSLWYGASSPLCQGFIETKLAIDSLYGVHDPHTKRQR